MGVYQRRNHEAVERQRQRQEREDVAPRLMDEVPSLRTLRLAMRFRRGEHALAESEHVRIVVVPRAAALFVVPCSDPQCKDGGHDVTHMVMAHLRSHHTSFEGNCSCSGSLGAAAAPCGRILSFEANATYAP